jgi:iron complex transport system substrate-binding protein
MAEIIFALGSGDHIVGVSEYTTYPPESLQIPIIGTAITPNKEKLLILKPDIIIGQGKQPAINDFCRIYKVKCISLRMDNMNDVYSSIQIIADILHKPDKGSQLVADIKEQIATVQLKIANKPFRKVLFLFGRQPGDLTGLTTIGPGSFLDELITAAGGSNIFYDATGPYPQISKESLVMRQPEIIMELHPAGISKEKAATLHKDWARLPPIPAVKSDHIYYMTNDYLLIPGPRMGKTVQCFAETIHPEAFNE